MENIVEMKNYHKSYGNRQVLSGVNFNVKKGTIHGLLGPNGAGKTTTMKCLIGLIRGDQGELYVQSYDCQKNYNKNISIGYLLEQPPLYEDLLVSEYLTYLAKIQGVEEKSIQARIDEVVKKLGLGEVITRRVGNLSKGYKQRLGIAQAIVHDPKIVILDEPTLGLDPQTVIEMRNLILELKESHTIIVSSHQLHEMGLICDEITILMQGKVVQSGTQKEISEQLEKTKVYELKIVENKEKFMSFLESLDWIDDLSITKQEEETLIKFAMKSDKDRRAEIVKSAVAHNIDVLEFRSLGQSLEDIFIDVTSKT